MELSYVLNRNSSPAWDVISFVEILFISLLNLLFKFTLEAPENVLKFQEEINSMGIISSVKIFSIFDHENGVQNHFCKAEINSYRRGVVT
ncbi:hypothetical protein NLM59_08225 [Weeksellaceae bacterium KMM 9724]|uniref:hypothetical protein n=1 Tax=Profundicola chukchiensis TaxID=2961959 RepID=UPI0024378F0D|nr:hypothetical protein [Profundicola chukchiensis]MDG4950909.1 hypothetical protein [Profundicola chukchiensis]